MKHWFWSGAVSGSTITYDNWNEMVQQSYISSTGLWGASANILNLKNWIDASSQRYESILSSGTKYTTSTQNAMYKIVHADDLNSWNTSTWHNSGIIWDNSLNTWKAYKSGGGGTPGGGDTQVQYNNNGVFGGDANMIWDSGDQALFINGLIGRNNNNYIQTSISNLLNVRAGNSPILNFDGRTTPKVVDSNAENADVDFRVRTQNLNDVIFVDASTDKVGINTINQAYLLHVSGSIYAYYSISTQNLSGQLLALHRSRDINNWNSAYWHNSGIIWSNTEQKWLAFKSGAGGVSDHGGLTGLDDDDHSIYYNNTRLVNHTSTISSNALNAYNWTNSSSNRYEEILSSGVQYTNIHESGQIYSRFVLTSGTKYEKAYASSQLTKELAYTDGDTIAGNNLTWDGTSLNAAAGGGAGGYPSGADGNIQYKSGTSHGGQHQLNWSRFENRLTVSGAIRVYSLSSLTVSGGTTLTRNIYGGNAASDKLYLYANKTNTYPQIYIDGDAGILNFYNNGNNIDFYDQANLFFRMKSETQSKLWGQDSTGTDMIIYANTKDQYPYIRLDGSGNIYLYKSVSSNSISSQYLSGQIRSIHTARDISNWNSDNWHNSSLMWNKDGNNWIPKPSSAGGVSDHGGLTGLTDDDHTHYYNNTRLVNHTATISSNALNSYNWINASSQRYEEILASGSKYTASTQNALYHLHQDLSPVLGANLDGGNYAIENINDIYLSDKLYHHLDANTYLQFHPDHVILYIGGKEFLDMQEDSQCMFYFNSGGADMDFHFRGDISTVGKNPIFTVHGQGNVGINNPTPSYDFEVSGSVYAKYAVSTNRISSNSISSQFLSGQLKAIHTAGDIESWNSHNWHNSSLMWNNDSQKWIAKPSGGGSDGASTLKLLTDTTIADEACGEYLMYSSASKGWINAPPAATYSVGTVRLMSGQNINLARFKCPANERAWLWQAAACNSGGASISGLVVEMLSGNTQTGNWSSLYKTSNNVVQKGNPLAVSPHNSDIEIRFMYSGSNRYGEQATQLQYGTAHMVVSVY